LGRVCALQKQYGRTDAELQTLVEGFCWILSDYPMDSILMALKHYVMTKADIPTPADLRNIIDPPPLPLSGAVYIDIKKRGREDQFITRDEKEYCRKYEEQEMAKSRGGSEELRQAQAQIASHTRMIEGY
jgi:hypothetical protein